MESNELLREVAARFGVDDLKPDAEGRVGLQFDDMRVTMQTFEDLGLVAFYADVGDIPPEGQTQFYETALKQNWMFGGTGGNTLAIHPENGTLVLNRCERLAALESEAFWQMIEKFVDTLEFWRNMATDFRPDVTRRAPSAEPVAESDEDWERKIMMGAHGYMRV